MRSRWFDRVRRIVWARVRHDLGLETVETIALVFASMLLALAIALVFRAQGGEVAYAFLAQAAALISGALALNPTAPPQYALTEAAALVTQATLSVPAIAQRLNGLAAALAALAASTGAWAAWLASGANPVVWMNNAAVRAVRSRFSGSPEQLAAASASAQQQAEQALAQAGLTQQQAAEALAYAQQQAAEAQAIGQTLAQELPEGSKYNQDARDAGQRAIDAVTQAQQQVAALAQAQQALAEAQARTAALEQQAAQAAQEAVRLWAEAEADPTNVAKAEAAVAALQRAAALEQQVAEARRQQQAAAAGVIPHARATADAMLETALANLAAAEAEYNGLVAFGAKGEHIADAADTVAEARATVDAIRAAGDAAVAAAEAELRANQGRADAAQAEAAALQALATATQTGTADTWRQAQATQAAADAARAQANALDDQARQAAAVAQQTAQVGAGQAAVTQQQAQEEAARGPAKKKKKKGACSWLTKLFAGIGKLIGGVVGWIGKTVVGIVKGIGQTIVNFVTNPLGTLKQLFTLEGLLQTAANILLPGAGAVVGAILGFAKGDVIGGITSALGAFAPGAWSTTGAQIAQRAVDTLFPVVNFGKALFTDPVGIITKGVDGVIGGVGKAIDAVGNFGRNIGAGLAGLGTLISTGRNLVERPEAIGGQIVNAGVTRVNVEAEAARRLAAQEKLKQTMRAVWDTRRTQDSSPLVRRVIDQTQPGILDRKDIIAAHPMDVGMSDVPLLALELDNSATGGIRPTRILFDDDVVSTGQIIKVERLDQSRVVATEEFHLPGWTKAQFTEAVVNQSSNETDLNGETVYWNGIPGSVRDLGNGRFQVQTLYSDMQDNVPTASPPPETAEIELIVVGKPINTDSSGSTQTTIGQNLPTQQQSPSNGGDVNKPTTSRTDQGQPSNTDNGFFGTVGTIGRTAWGWAGDQIQGLSNMAYQLYRVTPFNWLFNPDDYYRVDDDVLALDAGIRSGRIPDPITATIQQYEERNRRSPVEAITYGVLDIGSLFFGPEDIFRIAGTASNTARVADNLIPPGVSTLDNVTGTVNNLPPSGTVAPNQRPVIVFPTPTEGGNFSIFTPPDGGSLIRTPQDRALLVVPENNFDFTPSNRSSIIWTPGDTSWLTREDMAVRILEREGYTFGTHVGQNSISFSGHGLIDTALPQFQLAPGTSFTIYGRKGGVITDRLGGRIETGGAVDAWNYTFRPGDQVPPLVLLPPTGLNIQLNPAALQNPGVLTPGIGSGHPSGLVVGQPTFVGDLLTRLGSGDYHWSACLQCEIAPGAWHTGDIGQTPRIRPGKNPFLTHDFLQLPGNPVQPGNSTFNWWDSTVSPYTSPIFEQILRGEPVSPNTRFELRSIDGLDGMQFRSGVFDPTSLHPAQQVVYNALGDTPRPLNIRQNDLSYGGSNATLPAHLQAHTLDRHGASIPLPILEQRIYGTGPWKKSENFSYRWASDRAMNETVNSYLNQNWGQIRQDLTQTGWHSGYIDAGQMIGDGFYNPNQGFAFGPATGPRTAQYNTTSLARVTFRLDPADPTRVYVLTAFPTGTGDPDFRAPFRLRP
jgi:hypothetical protein